MAPKSFHDKWPHPGLVTYMNTFPAVLLMTALMAGPAATQVVPAHPDRFKNRPTGNTSTGSFELLPKNGDTSNTIRYITYIVLSTDRFWTSTEGKLIQGKLIAFEDMVTEAPKGTAQPPNPTPPESPTIVRDGRIRLLMKNKPVVVPLTRFSKGDLEFVEQVRKAYTKQASPEP